MTLSLTYSRPMSGLARRLLAPFVRWHVNRASERALESMPTDLRKDLGWPAAGDMPRIG